MAMEEAHSPVDSGFDGAASIPRSPCHKGLATVGPVVASRGRTRLDPQSWRKA